MAIGRVDAPVVIVEWADFQCPFCGKFARDTQPALVKKYVATGELRIEWRDFPYLGAQSRAAALAARAAAAQGKFWAYHDALYADQHAVNSGYLTSGYLTDIATKVGLNVPRFATAMQSKSLAAKVNADFEEGTSIGINGTPAFLVGTTPVMGAQPASVYEKLIDKQLSTS